MTLSTEITSEAVNLGACSLIHGGENEEELVRLFLTTQGIEFCAEHNFPTISQMLRFAPSVLLRNHIYVNTPGVTLENGRKVVLVGNTTAKLKYDDPSKRHNVILMKGASAEIEATNYAIVFVENYSTGVVKKRVIDNAQIL